MELAAGMVRLLEKLVPSDVELNFIRDISEAKADVTKQKEAISRYDLAAGIAAVRHTARGHDVDSAFPLPEE